MSEALFPLLLAAALVLCAAAVAKLRRPAAAAQALRTLGLPSSSLAVRALGVLELSVATLAVTLPAAGAAALAGLYAVFAAAGVLLARRSAECGCFGDGGAPASMTQPLLSGALAMTGVLGTVWSPRTLGWIASDPAVAIGAAGLAYAFVIAYTELPRAWAAWGTP